jgi:hypothetical protein
MKTYREFIIESNKKTFSEAISSSSGLMNLLNRPSSSIPSSTFGPSGLKIPSRPNMTLPTTSRSLTSPSGYGQSPTLNVAPSKITAPTSNFATPAKPKEDALTTWARSNKAMIQKSGTQAQKDILSQVETGKTPTLKPIGGGSIFDKEGGRDQYLANMRRSIRGGSQYNSGARTTDVTNISAGTA